MKTLIEKIKLLDGWVCFWWICGIVLVPYITLPVLTIILMYTYRIEILDWLEKTFDF